MVGQIHRLKSQIGPTAYPYGQIFEITFLGPLSFSHRSFSLPGTLHAGAFDADFDVDVDDDVCPPRSDALSGSCCSFLSWGFFLCSCFCSFFSCFVVVVSVGDGDVVVCAAASSSFKQFGFASWSGSELCQKLIPGR